MAKKETSDTFDAKRYFTGNWYHIATNVKQGSSIVDKLKGYTQTCDNVIIAYSARPDGNFNYEYGCYVNKVLNQKASRSGTIVPAMQERVFTMNDSKDKTPKTLKILLTDYDNFAVVSNGDRAFWILSRHNTICSNLLMQAKSKIASLGFSVEGITVGLDVIQDCAGKK